MPMVEVLKDFELAGESYVAGDLVSVEEIGGQVKHLLAMEFVLPYVPGEERAGEPLGEELPDEEA